MSRALFTLITLLLLPFGLLAQEEVKIGKETLKLTIPDGFEKLTGVNKVVDATLDKLVPPTNRPLLVVATPSVVTEAKGGKLAVMERYMMAQTYRATENAVMTGKDFAEVITLLEKQFAPKDGTLLGEVTTIVNKHLAEAKELGGLKVGGTVNLGVYEKTAYSVDSGMLLSVEVPGGKTVPMVGAIGFVSVRGKLLYLYVYSHLRGEDDVAWTRATLKAWREAVVKANP